METPFNFNKQSKSITKGMSKPELWKEKTGWKFENAFRNNINKNNKTIDLSARTDTQCFSSFLFCGVVRPFESSFLFCRPDTTRWKNYCSFAGPLEKSTVICWPCPLEKSFLICRPRPVQTSSWLRKNESKNCFTSSTDKKVIKILKGKFS